MAKMGILSIATVLLAYIIGKIEALPYISLNLEMLFWTAVNAIIMAQLGEMPEFAY